MERSAKNEALLREVNDRIEEVGERLQVLPENELLEFRCECGRLDCDATISLTVEEYELVRADNDRFAVSPGHEEAELERALERTARYVVVDKLPPAERFVGADGLPESGG